MNEQRQRSIQEPKDSLHWISYNLKNLVNEVKAIGALLANMSQNLPKKTTKSDDEMPF